MAERVVRVVRTPPLVEPPPGRFLAGAAERDVTPNPGIPTAGYSFMAQHGNGAYGRLFARALYLRDAEGRAAAVVLLDMMSASRYLLEKSASLSAPETGITVDRLVLAGTHTHTGPGWFYAQTLYDTFAQTTPGFDRPLCDWLASRIAEAILEAKRSAVPALVGMDFARVWGVSRNRSYPPFLRNPEHARWNDAGMPGSDPPPDLKPRQKAIDPRVRVLAAVRADDRAPIAAFSWFACHGGALGCRVAYYAPDWWGYAIRRARRDIEARFGGSVVVAMAASGAGDANALRPGPDDPAEQEPLEPVDDPMPAGPELAGWVGDAVGQGVAAAFEKARAAAGAPTVVTRFREHSLTHPEGDVPDECRLATRWCFGAPTIGGSEESRTESWRLGLAREGMTENSTFPPDDPQYPKVEGAGPVQDVLRTLLNLAPTPVLPLSVLRLGDDVIATVPGEPTATTAHRIERRLLAARWPTPRNVLVSGYANDFGAYYTTREEYGEQHYEGGSTLYGKNASAHVAWRLATIAETDPDPRPTADVAFEPGLEVERFHPVDDCAGSVDPQPTVSRFAGRVTVSWRMPLGCRVALWRGPLVQVLLADGTAYALPADRGRPFDDVTQAVLVQRHRSDGWFPGVERWLGRRGWPERWSAELDLPFDAPPDLRVRVAPRDGFAGFTLPIPR